VCKLYLLFISAHAAQEKKEKKVLLPAGVSKSTARTVKVALTAQKRSSAGPSHIKADFASCNHSAK
jgi:hypothetical protein